MSTISHVYNEFNEETNEDNLFGTITQVEFQPMVNFRIGIPRGPAIRAHKSKGKGLIVPINQTNELILHGSVYIHLSALYNIAPYVRFNCVPALNGSTIDHSHLPILFVSENVLPKFNTMGYRFWVRSQEQLLYGINYHDSVNFSNGTNLRTKYLMTKQTFCSIFSNDIGPLIPTDIYGTIQDFIDAFAKMLTARQKGVIEYRLTNLVSDSFIMIQPMTNETNKSIIGVGCLNYMLSHNDSFKKDYENYKAAYPNGFDPQKEYDGAENYIKWGGLMTGLYCVRLLEIFGWIEDAPLKALLTVGFEMVFLMTDVIGKDLETSDGFGQMFHVGKFGMISCWIDIPHSVLRLVSDFLYYEKDLSFKPQNDNLMKLASSSRVISGNSFDCRNLIGNVYEESPPKILDTIKNLKGVSYDSKKHEDKTLDDYLISQKDLNESQNTNLINKTEALEKIIPTTKVVNTTVLDIINDGNNQLDINLKNHIIAENTKIMQSVNELNDKVTERVKENEKTIDSSKNEIVKIRKDLNDGLDSIKTKFNEVNITIRDEIEKLQKRINELPQIDEGKIGEIERDVEKLRDELKGIVGYESLVSQFNLYIDKMFSTPRFSRRCGYFNVPAIGLFEGPTLLITNEGNILTVDMQKNLVTLINAPKNLVENYTFNIKFIAIKPGWIVFLVKDLVELSNFDEEKMNVFKSLDEFIIYKKISLGKKYEIKRVIYLTYGSRVYI